MKIVLGPMRADELRIYKMQVEDKACTICKNVGIGGKICEDCCPDRKYWVNAFETTNRERTLYC